MPQVKTLNVQTFLLAKLAPAHDKRGVVTPSSAQPRVEFAASPAGTPRLGAVALFAGVAAIGGFLFGYDTAVINGANTYLQTHFALDSARDAGWIGLATASAILGCIPGAMCAGFISDRFGRKRMLFLCALLYAISGVLSAIPVTFAQFVSARILSGIAIGASSMICPVYIAEISPPRWRGRLGSLFQFGIVTGIFLTLFANHLIQGLGDTAWNVARGWRWMLAAETLPAIVFLVLLLVIPESPRWLFQAGLKSDATVVFARIGGARYAAEQTDALAALPSEPEAPLSELFSRRYRLPAMIAFALMVGSQFSGINAIMYYSTEIFMRASGDANVAFRSSLWIGLINFLATFGVVIFVDRSGRRPLLLFGNAAQAIALIAVGVIFRHDPHSPALLWCVIAYIAAFATAMGPLPWIVSSEIFPARLRGRAMSLATVCIWTACLAVAQTFPMLLDAIGPAGTFWLYGGCSLATLLFVWRWLPETKGRSLEQIEQSWSAVR